MKQGFSILQYTAFMLSIILLSACGIENPVYLYPPRNDYNNSNLEDESKRFCRFITSDSDNALNASGYFQGFEIYYRIYATETECVSSKNVIDKYNDDNPLGAAQYLIASKNYQPLALNTIDGSLRPLISSASGNRTVRFRLQDYGTADKADLKIDGLSKGIPYRSNSVTDSKRAFNGQNIAAGDSDVQLSSSNEAGEYWYVNFYAVAYGYDSSFKTAFSAPTPLGYIKVKKKN